MAHTKQYTLDGAIRRGWRKLAESSEKFNNRGVSALHVAKYLLYFCGDFHTCILMESFCFVRFQCGKERRRVACLPYLGKLGVRESFSGRKNITNCTDIQ